MLNLYQACDDGDDYKNLNELHDRFNTEAGDLKNIKISENKLKEVVLLLLAYNKNIITFE